MVNRPGGQMPKNANVICDGSLIVMGRCCAGHACLQSMLEYQIATSNQKPQNPTDINLQCTTMPMQCQCLRVNRKFIGILAGAFYGLLHRSIEQMQGKGCQDKENRKRKAQGLAYILQKNMNKKFSAKCQLRTILFQKLFLPFAV